MFKAYVKKKEDNTKEKIALAYINARWTIQWLSKRDKQPKPLESILKDIGKEKATMTDKQMLERVKILNAMFGGEIIGS